MKRLVPFAALLLLSASTCDSNVGDGGVRGRETVRMSQRADGGAAAVDCARADISADGRYVVFESSAEDLALPDGNGWRDIFLKDRATNELFNLTRISPALESLGRPLTTFMSDAFSPRVSADGRYVAFLAKGYFAGGVGFPSIPTGGMTNVFVLDRQAGVFKGAVDIGTYTWPDRDCSDLSMSDDGRFVCFQTASSNLGFANANFSTQVCAVDFQAVPPLLKLVSRSAASATTIANGPVSGPRMSRDGSTITFMSSAANLGAGGQAHVYAGTPAGDVPEMVTVMPGTSTPALGAYLHPCVGGPGGRYVAFNYFFSDLPTGQSSGIARIDRVAGTVAHLADDQWYQNNPPMLPSGTFFSIADDGSIAYQGEGTITPIYSRRSAASRIVASTSSTGAAGELSAFRPTISGDGRWVVYESAASNLVEGDANVKTDVFVHGPLR